MNEHERQTVKAKLAASRERLFGAVDGLTAEQWTFRPGEGRWSINECVEHVMNVENRVLGSIGKKVAEPLNTNAAVNAHEAPPESARQAKDAEIAVRVIDRTTRRQAPEATRPTGQWPEPGTALEEFRKTRARTEQFVAGSDADLRSYFIPHGAFGELDCYQWLILLGSHAERHTLQIEEIKSDSAFPASRQG
jgi:uncharacterized damage-inducible protein DinB